MRNGAQAPAAAGATVAVRNVAAPPGDSVPKFTPPSSLAGTSYLGQADGILIKSEQTEFRQQLTKMITIGRSDSGSTFKPDIDLEDLGAVEKGVSRRHAQIELGDGNVTIHDLDSANGTYLNGQRLPAFQPRILHNGDELRFGKLTTNIFFVQSQ